MPAVIITQHAAERYVERVKPHLTRSQAFAELLRICPTLPVVSDRPAWMFGDRYATDCS